MDTDELIDAFNAGVAMHSRRSLTADAFNEGVAATSDMFTLTPREYSIAECLSRGLSNRATGKEIGITEGTVKVYLSRLTDRLPIPRGQSPRYTIAMYFRAGRLRAAPPQRGGRRLLEPRPEPRQMGRRRVKPEEDNAKWNKVFAERFEDPEYYHRPAGTLPSSLAGNFKFPQARTRGRS